MSTSKNYWFVNKTYGWGWTPSTWQGWLITFIYIIIILAFSLNINDNSTGLEVALYFGLPMLISTAIFIFIAYKKGEKPRWRWGPNT